MHIIAILLPLILGGQALTQNYASILLDPASERSIKGPFAPGNFELKYKTAFVAQGSYSGLTVTFVLGVKDEQRHELVLFIPGHEGFRVGYDSRKGEYSIDQPKLPYTLLAKNTAHVKDRRKRPRPMKIELTHWKKSGPQTWSTDSVGFSDCKITVETMSVAKQLLDFSGTFRCSDAQGRFSLAGAKLGVSKVD